jgi:hypothetical protein
MSDDSACHAITDLLIIDYLLRSLNHARVKRHLWSGRQ